MFGNWLIDPWLLNHWTNKHKKMRHPGCSVTSSWKPWCAAFHLGKASSPPPYRPMPAGNNCLSWRCAIARHLAVFHPVQRFLIPNRVSWELDQTRQQSTRVAKRSLPSSEPWGRRRWCRWIRVIICGNWVAALATAPLSRGDLSSYPRQHAAKGLSCFPLSPLKPDWREEKGHQASLSSLSFLWWIMLRAF